MKYLIILNDAPYGSERSHIGLRLANSLARQEGVTISVFLMGDAAGCAMARQTTPNGYYNIERMPKRLAAEGARIGICGSCMDARGVNLDLISEATKRSSMGELNVWTQEADKIIVF